MRKYLLAGAAALAVTAGLGNAARATAVVCSNNDLSFMTSGVTYTPTSCASNISQNGGTTAETANINSAFNFTGTKLYSYVAKDTDNAGVGTFMGLQFKLTDKSDATTSAKNDYTYALTWKDTNGSVPLNLPATLNLILADFGGDTGDAYLLSGVVLNPDATGSGEFDITFQNRGGQNPDLSHLDLLAYNPGQPIPTPEPATMAILGAGLFGLGAVRRRRI
jgi:hypothetical protein